VEQYMYLIGQSSGPYFHSFVPFGTQNSLAIGKFFSW